MEPLSAIAATLTNLICAEAAKKIGKEVLTDAVKGTVGAAYAKLKQLIGAIRQKFQAEAVEGILNKAQENPDNPKAQTKLQAELLDQMECDRAFAQQLQTLLQELETEPAIQQILLKNINIQGQARFGNIRQTSDRTTGQSQQQALVDIEVDKQGNLTLGDIEQEN